MLRIARPLALAFAASLAVPATAGAAESGSPPAGGAEAAQVAGASAAATLLTVALVTLGLGHRSGRVALLGTVARWAAQIGRLPVWAALPAGIAAGSLICAVFGLYWDVSLHIDNGRDDGPLANPSHYFILAGLFGIFAAGWFALVLPRQRPSTTAIRLGRDWDAPVSGILLMACASFALVGFPLDDVSHRLFGQDVTLWGPTHLMMLGGAAMTLIAILALLAEARLAVDGEADGRAATAEEPRPHGLLAIVGVVMRAAATVLGALISDSQARTLRIIGATGGLLIGLSIFQGEFDFGVPQFRLVYHPVLIALAAGVALTCARVLGGRGIAFGAVAFFLVLRGALTVVVGPLFGESVAHFPLYLAEAAIIELVALWISPRTRPWRFAIVGGALIGTVGTLAEHGWSHVWMPMPWPEGMLPLALALSLVTGVAAAMLGAFIGVALRLRADQLAPRAPRLGALAALAALAAVIAGLAVNPAPEGRALVSLRDVGGGGSERLATAIVRIEPASLARDADWIGQISWQGRDRVRVASLQRIADGVYRTREPLPVSGEWKSYIRLDRGATLAGIPVYAPADPAIPVGAIPAPPRFERPFEATRELLQRERKPDTPGWLWALSGAVVLAISLALIALIAWTLLRIGRAGGSRTATGGPDVVDDEAVRAGRGDGPAVPLGV